MPDIRDLADDFVSKARRFAQSSKSAHATNRVWTAAVLRHFQRRGRDGGFKVYPRPGPRKKYYGQYLVDLCWLEEYDRGGKGHWMELAVECEWRRYYDPIWYDFYKLLCVRSRLNLFICRAPIRWKGYGRTLNSPSLVAKLASEIRAHKRQVGDEEYGIITFPPNFIENTSATIETWLFDNKGAPLPASA